MGLSLYTIHYEIGVLTGMSLVTKATKVARSLQITQAGIKALRSSHAMEEVT